MKFIKAVEAERKNAIKMEMEMTKNSHKKSQIRVLHIDSHKYKFSAHVLLYSILYEPSRCMRLDLWSGFSLPSRTRPYASSGSTLQDNLSEKRGEVRAEKKYERRREVRKYK